MKTSDESACFHKKVLCAHCERDGPGTQYRNDEHITCHYSPIYIFSIASTSILVQREDQHFEEIFSFSQLYETM